MDDVIGSLCKPRNFKKVRQMMLLTQADLAHKMGLSVQTISNYETGRKDIPEPAASRLRMFLQSHRNALIAHGLRYKHEGDRRSVENGHSYGPTPSLEELFS